MSEAPSAERNIRIVIEYDGTRFLGWQMQQDGPSIQGAIQDAIFAVTGQRPHIQAAGRTDAGVHAYGQVASFRVTSHVPGWKFAPALNAHLPDDICIHEASDVAPSFDARQDSVSKRYRYRVYRARERAALEHDRAWLVRPPLDVEAMRQASRALIGEQDFEAFRSAHCDADHAVRMMFSIDIEQRPRPPVGEHVDITFHANAYCRHMCRILSGTLVEVGLGKRSPDDVAAVLASRDRKRAGITAPPHGLTLLEVRY